MSQVEGSAALREIRKRVRELADSEHPDVRALPESWRGAEAKALQEGWVLALTEVLRVLGECSTEAQR